MQACTAIAKHALSDTQIKAVLDILDAPEIEDDPAPPIKDIVPWKNPRFAELANRCAATSQFLLSLNGSARGKSVDRAIRAGYVMLGDGHFSTVFAHPCAPGVAFKVGFDKEDSGSAYAAFSSQHQGEAGIPEMYFMDRGETVYVVAMKQYQSYRKDDHSAAMRIAAETLETTINAGEYNRAFYYPACPLVKTVLAIHKCFVGVASFDLHPSNLMLDENNDFIITDPVSHKA